MTSFTSRLAEALAGRYDIEREIGAGGMATAFLATDTRHGRRVAIKVLRPVLSIAFGAARFLAEIRTTANLLHPHILPLRDSGEVNGTIFCVMPYVEGPTLCDRIARAAHLPVDEAVRIAVEVADALQHAHPKGVVHRDIKPANILLEGDHAVVADFGIALAHRTHDDLRMTDTGMSLGTPTYMSPQQAAGERHLDARTDVYAPGCVLYEMLAGVPPFEATTAQGPIGQLPLRDQQPRSPPLHGAQEGGRCAHAHRVPHAPGHGRGPQGRADPRQPQRAQGERRARLGGGARGADRDSRPAAVRAGAQPRRVPERGPQSAGRAARAGP